MALEAPVELMVAVLGQQVKSDSAVKRLIELDQEGTIELLGVAVLIKDEEGKITIQETRDLNEAEDAVLGALAGGALGLFAGIIGLVVGATAGAAAGYVTGHVADLGMSDEHLRALAQELPPGTSAILALIEHESVEPAMQELQPLVSGLSRFALAVEAPGPAGEGG
jgi:uncharacterized membrane protein